MRLCLDTYALCEILDGNNAYLEIVLSDFCIPKAILAEFYYILCRDKGEELANEWFEKLKPYTISISLETWIKAVKYRLEHKKQNISLYDSIGYITAIEKGMLFVTGDKEFKNKKSVRFLK